MKIKAAMIISTLAIMQFGLSAASQEGTITVQRLNIRVKPGNSAVVGAFKKGDKITVQEVKNGWCRIALPKDASVWVASKFVKDGKVIKSVNLRSGPGLNYGSFGIVEVGQTVTILDNKNKDWLKIEPLPNISGWVAAQHVKLEKGAAAATETTAPTGAAGAVPAGGQEILNGIDAAGTKEAAKEPAKVAEATPDKAKETAKEPAKAAEATPDKTKEVAAADKQQTVTLPEENTEELEKQLPFVDEPAEDVSFEGILVALNPGSVVVTHALSIYEKGQYKPVCFLYSHSDELAKYLEQRVKITGKKRWIKLWKTPVVKVMSITPLNP